MKRDKPSALTETTTYILLAFKTPSHGYAVMQQIDELTGHRVQIAAGTMYGAIENLLKQKWIEQVAGADPRRKLYRLTESGEQTLNQEIERLKNMLKNVAEIMDSELSGERI